MFLDYVTIMLINMAAGLVLLASFVRFGLEREDQTRWAGGFAITGLLALLLGLHMTLTWPLPGSFNMAFGECSLLFGALFLGAALAIARRWNISSVALYALFAGIVPIIIGLRIAGLGLTKAPALSAAGFLLTGLSGVGAYPALLLHRHRFVRTIGAIVLLLAALTWAIIGYAAYWGHMESFTGYRPPLMLTEERVPAS